MDEEAQKRNTDCVYFLASPLTCKKGIDCEYRHSEIARLNPRDCWYWLAGSCLNPTCAFRHPPLEGRTEASSESTPLHSQSAAPVNKTNAPCYFYFNGFCNKGERCSFLHGPDDGTPACKSLKTAPAVTDALSGPSDGTTGWKSLKIAASAVADAIPMEKKASAGSGTGSGPTETRPNSYETAPRTSSEIQKKLKEDIHQSVPTRVAEQSASPHISASECEGAAAVRSDSLLPAEGFIQSRSLVCTDQSLEEPWDGHIEREECLESPPGFDVLVDGRSENLDYEDDPEYLMGLDGEGRELNGQFMGYDYEDPLDYDPAYPDSGILYEQEKLDSYDHLDNARTYDNVRKNPGRLKENMGDHILPRKRKSVPTDLAFDGQSGMDLRDHLNKRRVIDGLSVTNLSRRHNSSRLLHRSKERPRRQGSGRLQGRLMSNVENDIVGSCEENETPSNGANLRGRLRHPHMNRSRQRFEENRQGKQQFLSSEVSRKSVSEERSTEESTMFSGPKTLAQIREEKRKAQENGDSYGEIGHSSRIPSEDFEGPKPLSEILKDKRRLGSVMNGNNDDS